MSCDTYTCHVTLCHVLSCHVMSRHVTSCLVMSCHVMSSHVISRFLTSCHVMSCHVMSRHDTLESCSRIFLPSLLNSSIMAAGWPRRGFRNRGPVRESGSERRSRCGAARIASMPRGRRGGWCDLGIVLRGRLRGSGVPRAYRGCAAALCRGDWVRGAFCTRMANVRFASQAAGIVRAGRCVAGMPHVPRRSAVRIGFGARFVHAWPTCVSRGRLRGSCVLGGVSRACRGCAAALCREDWVRGAFCTRMANVRFAWPAAGIVRAGRCVAGVSRACRGAVPWGLGSARVACVACAALCHGDCWWARLCHGDCRWVCRVGVAGWPCAMGIAAGRVAWVALCHGDCWWASRLGAAMLWRLLGSASSRWRRVLGIADQGVVWVAPCH